MECNLPFDLVKARYARGWRCEQALSMPEAWGAGPSQPYEFEELMMQEWAERIAQLELKHKRGVAGA